jgi:hypothetical protein
MSEDTRKKPQDVVRPSPRAQGDADSAATGKVSIDRYREALRKGVLLSQ